MSFHVCIGQLMDRVYSAVVFTDASSPFAYPSNKSLVCCFCIKPNVKLSFNADKKKKRGKQIHANNYARFFCWLYCSIPGVTATSALKDGLMKGFLLAKTPLLSIISVLFCEKWNSAFCTCALSFGFGARLWCHRLWNKRSVCPQSSRMSIWDMGDVQSPHRLQSAEVSLQV